jgi:MYXO-CTERM domain-containing protein
MLPDGGILIVGHDGADAVLTRVDRNGQFDADFGAGTGSVRLDLGAAFLGLTGSRSSVHDFVLTPDAAHVYLQLTVLHADGTAACGGGIARILLDGTPDISFGKQGLTCLDYGSFWLKRLVGSQRNGSPLFEVWYDAFYRLLMDATPSPGMLTKVCNGPIVHVGEADRTVAVSVVRTAGNDGPVSLDYATGQRGELYYNDDIVDHLTTADADYQSTSGRLDWADEDDGVREINITILDDELVETDEYFSIQLSNLRGRALTPPDGDTRCFHVGIDDDDDGVPSPSPAPPPAPQPTLDSGGGGSFSWPTLLLAAGLLLGHRRRRRLITTSPLDGGGDATRRGLINN